MLPGRWPNYPDAMWNYGWSAPVFPSPQPAVPFGQFCGGDMMSQQSQAQSQAQTQAQLAQLREQNSILGQQLASQAQTHIQHLQQLLPFHQSNPPVMQSQSTPPAPDPPTPTPVAPPSTQPGSNVVFNPEEMMQQMRHTVESGMQAFVDKNKERPKSPPPHAEPPPTPVPPPIPSHPPPPDSALPPLPRLHRRSRSRSQRHRSVLDKRPVSIPRSPRREKSPSRPRHRRRHSTSRDWSRLQSRAPSVTLRSASPRRREALHGRDDDYSRDDPRHQPASLQPACWEHQSNYRSYDQPSTTKWKSWGQWKDYSKTSYYTHPSGWIDYSKPTSKNQVHYDPSSKPSSKPLTAFSSDHTSHGHSHHPRRSGSVQSRCSTTVPPGHVPINLQDGSKDEWARHIRHAMHHPDRNACSKRADR